MPQNIFNGIIGHAHVQEVLNRMVETDQVPHAFLFLGANHLGKTLVATQLIRSLFPGMGSFDANPDIVELSCLIDEKTGKKKSNISAEQVRELCERLSLSSMNGGWKVAFIKDASALSTGAANALLKTLEEPKGKMLFILRAPSLESVLPTVASRCQVVRFHSVPRIDLVAAMVKKGFARPDAEVAAAISLGKPGRALRYLTKSEDKSNIDVGTSQALHLFSSSIATQLKTSAELLPKEDVNKKHAAEHVVARWQGVLRDVMLEKIGCTELVAHQNELHGIKSLGKTFALEQIIHTLHTAEESRAALAHNTNPLLTLEHILLNAHV